MYKYEDLVAALQSGVSVEDIAAQMTKDLNAAKAEYDRLAAEKAAAEKKANEQKRKIELAANIYLLLGEYITSFHPNSLVASFVENENGVSAETAEKLAGELDNLVNSFEAFNVAFGDLSKLFAEEHNTITDPIEDFLNKNVRKLF